MEEDVVADTGTHCQSRDTSEELQSVEDPHWSRYNPEATAAHGCAMTKQRKQEGKSSRRKE